MIKQSVITIASLLLLSGCVEASQEVTNAVIVAIDDKEDTVDILTEDYKNHTLSVEEQLLSSVNEGDIVNITIIGDKIIDINVLTAEPTPQSTIDVLFSTEALSNHAVITADMLIADYGLTEEQLIDGVAYLPTIQGDINEFVWLCGDEHAIELLLNDFKDGMAATYDNDEIKKTIIDDAYISVKDNIGILIIGDTDFKQSILNEIDRNQNELSQLFNEQQNVMEEGVNEFME